LTALLTPEDFWGDPGSPDLSAGFPSMKSSQPTDDFPVTVHGGSLLLVTCSDVMKKYFTTA
jgi:hypothetical protein